MSDKSFIRNNFKIALLYLIFLLSWFIVGQFVQGFGTSAHFAYLLQLAGFLGIVAAGQTLVLLIGGIDLSVGMVITFGGILTTLLLSETGLGLSLVIPLTLGITALVGAVNGLGISMIGIPPLVMTLATSSIVQGAALILTNGTPQAANIAAFQKWVNTNWFFGLNGVVFVWLVVTVAVIFILNKTTFGKKIYYLGSNTTAAIYSGHNPWKVIVTVYALSGLLSGLTGILLVGYTGRSYFGMGNTYLLLSIAAVVVGGTSVLGGKGNYSGTAAGVLLLTLISSVLILFKISYGGQLAIQGFIILALVVAYSLNFDRNKSF